MSHPYVCGELLASLTFYSTLLTSPFENICQGGFNNQSSNIQILCNSKYVLREMSDYNLASYKNVDTERINKMLTDILFNLFSAKISDLA